MIKNIIFILFAIIIGCHSPKKKMKHPLDRSSSKTVQLENGLKVYLLSDPDLNVSSASMAVEVGAYQNPDDRQGLAHFLEHMLFLGTEKFPTVDGYKNHIKNNGGYSNAYTSGDHTNYQFEILPDGYKEALDRFSQFFIAPLFTEEYTQREVNAVHSEYQKNIMNDGRRTGRIIDLHLKEGHSAQTFTTGNLETLGGIERGELIEFYDKHYSANIMGLALLSSHSLEKLESWATQYFSNIPNKNIERNAHDPEVIVEEKAVRIINIEPVKDLRDLQLTFQIPGSRHLYESKPGQQFGFILGHEGKGSLLSYLKKEDLASTLSAGAWSATKEYGYAYVSIGLTDKGLKEYKNVVKSVYSYIQLMKKSGYQKQVYDELKTMASLNEVYSSKGEGARRATQLANESIRYPLKDVGRINYIYRKDNPDVYESLLDNINLEKMLVALIAKDLHVDSVEHFYQAKYSLKTDETLFQELSNMGPYKEFEMPALNPFIPRSLSIPERDLKDAVYPQKIEMGEGVSLFFGQDHEFLRPKGVISLKIKFPKENMSLRHRVYSKFYSQCVMESLNEISYPARLAGLNYSINEGYEGIYLNIGGYKESAVRLYEMVLDHMVQFTISNEQFDAIKDKIIRSYENFSLTDAHRQTRELGPNIMNEVKFTWKQSLPVAKKISLDDLEIYSKDLYKKTYLEAMVYGDFEISDSKKVVSLFRDKTNTSPINKEESFDLKYIKMRKPEVINYIDTIMVNNSCFHRKYEIGFDSPKIRAISMLIEKSLEQPFFTEMRTNQQLGYIVWSYSRALENVYYLNFLIQSGEYAADELDQRANDFITSSPQILSNMDEETFEKLVASSIEELERKPKSISERASILNSLVYDYDANYNRDQETIEELSKIKKKEVFRHMSEILSEKSRKMVNILAFSNEHNNRSNKKSTFNDLESWKAEREYE